MSATDDIFLSREGRLMPQNMLKKMLYSLCCDGAEFCHPDTPGKDICRAPIVEVEEKPLYENAAFAENIPGGLHFSAEGIGSRPYYEPERHPGHVEIIFPLSGTADFLINGHWKKLEKPKTHILFQNTRHTERHCDRGSYTLLWLTSLPSSLTLHRTTYSAADGYGQSACRIAIMPPMAKALWECGSMKQPDETLYFSLLVQCLKFACSSCLTEQNIRNYHSVVVTQIKEFIDENFSGSISLAELAQMAHCSAIHLNRLFLAQYHKTIHQYLMELRLTEAKKLLKNGFSPTEVAHRVGIGDQRYFSRFFRRKAGCSPSEYQSGGKKG